MGKKHGIPQVPVVSAHLEVWAAKKEADFTSKDNLTVF